MKKDMNVGMAITSVGTKIATSDNARQIAEIIVEDWKIAYKGIIDSDFLDSMNVEERYQRELQRYQIYKVAEINGEIGIMI